MAAFTRGNIVVYRVGTGAAALSASATAVFLDEYTPGGVLVQSVPLPTAAAGSNYALTAAGNATTEGGMTLSADGQYLVFTGFNAAPGTATVAGSPSASVARVIGEVGANGVVSTTTGITTIASAEIRSAASVDGSAFWFTTATTGVDYAVIGASTYTTIASTPANSRDVEIYGGQLYVSSASGANIGINVVGAGTPTTSGQTATLLTGSSATAAYQFFFADLSSSVAGVDTLYVADGSSIDKFSLVGSTWTLDNKVSVGGTLFGLTGSVTGSTVSIFATATGSIYSLTDTAGYHVADNGTAASIATAGTNTAFRGVAFAPAAAVAAAPTLSISSPSVAEGNSGTKMLNFIVTASAASASDITFHYSTANGTATAGSDYVGVGDTVGTITAGQTTATIAVTINGDALYEADETLLVTLSSPTNATIATAQGTGTIQNDDAAPTITIDNPSVTEGNSGTVALTYTVSLSAASGLATTVNYATADGTATQPSDYTAVNGTLTFAPGETAKTVTVQVNGDTTYEPDETVRVNLSGASNATIATAQGTGTIVNDDAAPPVGAFTLAGDASAAEAAGSLSFTINRSGGSAGAASISYAVTGSGTNPANAADFTGGTLPSGTVNFVDGQTSAVVTVAIADDHNVEPDETFALTLSNPTGGASLGSASTATGTILNDDNAGSFALAGSVSQSEAAGAQTFTINRSGGSAGAATISYAVTGSGASPADAADFTGGTLPSGTVQFADGETSHTIVVPVSNDATYEPDETYTLTLTGATVGTLGQATATGTITNDDPVPPSLSINDVQVVEGDSGTTTLVFTITSSFAAPAGGISFAVATADGTATAASGDYVAQSTTGAIAAGQTSTTFTVVVNGDTAFERNETVLVNLSSPVNATIADGQGVGTIANDDAVPAGTTAAIFSADFAAFTAAGFSPGASAASGMLDSNVWRVLGASDATAPAYGFTGAANTDFGRGIIVGSADPTSGGVYSPSADHALVLQPTLTDFDANGAIEARIQNTSGATATSFDVVFDWAYRNSGDRAENMQLAYSTDGTNFTAVPAANFSTPGTKDAAVASTFTDQHEAVSITGTVADGGYLYLRWVHVSSSGGNNRDEVGIDNVGVTAHLSSDITGSISDISVTEGNSGTTAATFTVTRSNGAGTASVDYATADGTALAGRDYTAASGTVSFAVGETSKTVTVLVTGDTVHEADETFTLKLSNPVGFTVPQTTATATIVNDDDTGPVAIYDIEGLGHRSPFTGQSVTTSGVVTAVKSGGFYLQDAAGDNDIRTSDAIYVVTSGAPTVSVGNAITLTGTVAEYSTATNYLPLTELTGISGLTVTNATAALPAAVVIATDGTGRAPPTSVVDDDGLSSYDPTTDGADFYESLEGMLVTIKQPLVVANTDANGNTYVVASNGAGATGLNDRYGMTISAGDNNPETLRIYEGTAAAGAHSQGDVLGDVTGVVNYYAGRYEVDPTAAVTVQTDRPALARETTTLTGDANHLSYASFNVENLASVPDSSVTDRNTQAKVDAAFAAHANEIVNALHSPDVIGLQEVQDADGIGAGTDYTGIATANKLIAAIAAAGGPTYVYVEVAPTANNTTGGEPNGNIRPGFLYNPEHVSYVAGSARQITDAAFTGSRLPLVADFTFNGQTFTAIDVHSTSRGGSDPVYSANQPPVQAGDAGRTAQATAIKTYINNILASDATHQFVVNGDFNGFPYEAALQAITSDGKIDNLYDKLPVAERYSYYFDGYYQAFDNVLVSHALTADTTFDVIHYNAGFTDGLSATDHDQVLAEIGLARSSGVATAVADSFATTAAAIYRGTVLANDTAGAGTISVAAINGDTTAVGTSYRLSSGALLTLTTGGTFSYDPDGAFSAVAAGATTTDQFSYTLTGGSTATATVTVTGVTTPTADGNGHLNGTTGNDTYGGTTGADYFDLSTGGTDTVSGGAGADAFFFGAALTGADRVIGGSGYDQVGIQGDYTGANRLVMTPSTFANVELLAALPGYSYDITLAASVVGDAGKFEVYGTNLAAGNNLTVDGSAVTGALMMLGGLGTDTLTGGSGDDGFYFGPGRWQAGDTVHGGAGSNDQIGLDGSYTLTIDSHMDVEVVALLRGPDGDLNSFALTVADSFVEAGGTRTITGLSVATPLTIDGSGELDGHLRIFGGQGNDTITGGGTSDMIFGGAGADMLRGGGGADVFLYDDPTQSTGTGYDTLLDFDYQSDRIQISGQVHDTYGSVTSGRLDDATFDADIQTAVGSQLVNGAAVLFTATTGSHAGETFLIVDANGSAGYQAGGDYVFHMASAPTATPPDFIIP